MGEMKRAVAREEEARLRDRFVSTLVIAAAIIAAVRLAKDENISRSSPRVFSVISDSIALARGYLGYRCSLNPIALKINLRLSLVVQVFRSREERERYSHRASLEEIAANKFNLNIPRYVDTFVPEPEVDLQSVQNEIRELETKLLETRGKMNFYLKELGINV